MKKQKYYTFSTLVILVVLAGIFQPDYLKTLPTVNQLLFYLRAIGPILAIIYFFIVSRRLSKFTVIWIMLEMWLFVTGLINNVDMTNILQHVAQLMGVALLFDSFQGDNVDYIIKVIHVYLLVLLAVNLVTILLYPQGLYATGVIGETTENWFLGFKNTQIVYILPFLVTNRIQIIQTGRNCWRYVELALIIFTSLFLNSGTTILGVALFLILTFEPITLKLKNIMNSVTYFWVTIGLFIAIPILRAQRVFSFIIVDGLHKSMDLTGRTSIWTITEGYIRQHLLIGWGNQSTNFRHMMYMSDSVISAHNQFLEYLFQGGVILLALYIMMLWALALKISQTSSSRIEVILAALYLSFQVLQITEVHVEMGYYLLYFLMWHYSEATYKQVSMGENVNSELVLRT